MAIQQRADLLEANISANKMTFLRARATMKKNTVTASFRVVLAFSNAYG